MRLDVESLATPQPNEAVKRTYPGGAQLCIHRASRAPVHAAFLRRWASEQHRTRSGPNAGINAGINAQAFQQAIGERVMVVISDTGSPWVPLPICTVLGCQGRSSGIAGGVGA